MKFIDEFRDQALVKDLTRRLGALAAFTETPATVMEVCGTHTMAAARFGLKTLLPPGVTLISGPGCPVCVTDQSDLDAFLALGTEPGVVLVSFGDMLRVPGTHTSLEGLRAQGAEVRVVYSPLDAVELARQTPDKHLVFFGVGFETTMPATALAIQTAAGIRAGQFLGLLRPQDHARGAQGALELRRSTGFRAPLPRPRHHHHRDEGLRLHPGRFRPPLRGDGI